MTFDIDNVEVVNELLTLSDKDVIVWMSVFQNQYRVYSNIESLNTFQYFWDWTSAEFDYKVIWRHLPVRAIENDWGYDTAITWFNEAYSDIYQIAWSQRQEIRVNLEAATWARIFNDHISSREEIVYISWWTTAKKWVYSMWNYYPWMPNALVLEHPLLNDEILWHTHDISLSYFACNDGKVYQLSHNQIATHNTTWYIESLIFNWWPWNAYIKKSIEYAYIGFSQVDNSKTIELYAKVDWGSYKLLKTINWAHSNVRWVRIDRSEFITQELWDFFDLTYKIVLNWDWWDQLTSTPIFRWVETYITNNINK